MKKVGPALVVLVLPAATLIARGFNEPGNDVKDFMRAKLVHSQSVLEGLVLDDFAAILKASREMGALSNAAAWRVFQTPQYLKHSVEFRQSNSAMEKAAQAKDLDGALKAYSQLTRNCVACHKYVRRVRTADVDGATAHGLVLLQRAVDNLVHQANDI